MTTGEQSVSHYTVSIKDGWLDVTPLTTADELIVKVKQAVESVKAGETANLLGDDMVEFYEAAEEAGLKVKPVETKHPVGNRSLPP